MTWYDPDEIKNEALGNQRQPEFAPEADPADPEDTSWDSVQALIDRNAEIEAEVSTITQPYPTVSGDDPVSL